MRISSVAIKNFRNFADIRVNLKRHVVLVGENRSGKSNFLHAIRLIFDSALPGSERQLGTEDFWGGLGQGQDSYNPMNAGEVIEIAVEFTEFQDSDALMTVLGDAVVGDSPHTARVTYRYAPRPPLPGEADVVGRPYEWIIFPGVHEDIQITPRMRSFLHMSFLGALRDAEADIANWRKSPLKELLQSAADSLTEEQLLAVKTAIEDANASVGKLDPIASLSRDIGAKTDDIVGARQALDTELAVGPTDPLLLIRSLRMFTDGEARRPLGRTSLGTLNVLYFALNEMRLGKNLDEREIAHVILGIDEPEAHLHPHLQRLLYRRILNEDATGTSVFMTTQSPHLASVADPRSIVRLYDAGDRVETASASSADLDQDEWDDIGRYLDATRGELLFARKVIFVEGFAEQVMLPRLCSDSGTDLDKAGITVCSVHGTHFASYVKLAEALAIPWAVMTDGDRTENGTKLGDKRAGKLVSLLGGDADCPPDWLGIFVGETTFEYDLYRASNNNQLVFNRLLSSTDAEITDDRGSESSGTVAPASLDLKGLLSSIRRSGGKGRIAQKLATQSGWVMPSYIEQAITYIVAQ